MKIISFYQKNRKKAGLVIKNKIIDLVSAIKVYNYVFFGEEVHIDGIEDAFRKGLLDNDTVKNLVKWLDREKLDKIFQVKGKIKLTAPLVPGKIIALGRNYAAHAKETNAPVPEEPILFEKANSSVVGPEENVQYKKFLVKMDPKGVQVDHEVELAFIIGKTASNVKRQKAMDHVFGYTILNDVTARNVQEKDFAKKQPWFRSKSIDTFCPLGPWIITKDEIKQPNNLNIEIRVNGKIRQKSNTKMMIFKIPELIEYITKYITLKPGDIVSTGTPEGISPVYPGDIMEAKIEKIGVLRNKVVKEK